MKFAYRATEDLLRDITAYLTQPGDLQAMLASEPGLKSVTTVATNVLSFSRELGPDPRYPGEVQLTVRAVGLEEANRRLTIGAASLSASPFTQTDVFSVFPDN